MAATHDRPAEPSKPERTVAPGSADGIIFEHLAAGDVDWFRLATSLPGCHHGHDAVRKLADRPAGQAIMLAEAGASAAATAAVLRAEGVGDLDLRRHLSAVRVDAGGDRARLYHPDEVKEALATPRHVKQVADELVADLLVSTGKHPAAVLHLAKTSDQPSNVINLVEERFEILRRSHACAPLGRDGVTELMSITANLLEERRRIRTVLARLSESFGEVRQLLNELNRTVR